MTEEAAVPSLFTGGSVYAMVGSSTPEWRKVIKIEMTANGPQSTVVQDSKLVKGISEVVQTAMQELADADDTPEEQQLLMSAWQALAMYLSTCDDEDKSGALTALKLVSGLMADGIPQGPMPTGTFGATTQAAAKATGKTEVEPKDKLAPPFKKKGDKAAQSNSCLYCERAFGTEQGLINHLKTLHAAREKQAGYGKNPAAQDKD